MRLVYFPLALILWWSYFRALQRARDRHTPFTPLMGWLVGLGYFLLIPLTILILHGGYRLPEFYKANEQYASVDLADIRFLVPVLVIWIALFFTFEAISALRGTKKSVRGVPDLLLDDARLKRAILVSISLSVVDSLFTVWHSGGLESFLVSHWYLRQQESVAQLGDIFVLYAQLSLANQIVFTATSALFTARQLLLRKVEWRWDLLIGFGLLLEMIVSGNRIFMALYGLSFLVACWVYKRKKLIVGLGIVSPLIFLVFGAWASLRHDLGNIATNIPGYVQKDTTDRTMTTLMDSTEGVNIMQLLHMVNDFGGKFSLFYGATYLKAITFVVPRHFYPNKPDNYPVQIANLYEPGEVTSFGTTQLGELYANFGILSVLLLPLLTAMICLLSNRLAHKPESYCLLLAVLFILMIWFARSSFEDNFVTFLFSALLIWVFRLQRGLWHAEDKSPSSWA